MHSEPVPSSHPAGAAATDHGSAGAALLVPPKPPNADNIVLLVPHGWTWTTRPCGGSTRIELAPPHRLELPDATSRRIAGRLRAHLGDDPTDIAAALLRYLGSYASLAQYVTATLTGTNIPRNPTALEPMALGRRWLREGWIWLLTDPGDTENPPAIHVFRGPATHAGSAGRDHG